MKTISKIYVQGNTKIDDALQSQRTSLYAHAGFLNSAMKLIVPLSTQIENRLRQNPRQNILFTGHSAGGAVAALLHLSFRVKLGATC
jgi:predicted lipase